MKTSVQVFTSPTVLQADESPAQAYLSFPTPCEPVSPAVYVTDVDVVIGVSEDVRVQERVPSLAGLGVEVGLRDLTSVLAGVLAVSAFDEETGQ